MSKTYGKPMVSQRVGIRGYKRKTSMREESQYKRQRERGNATNKETRVERGMDGVGG